MLSLGCFLLLLLIGVPVALSVMAAAMLQIALAGNAALLFSVPQQAFGGIESYGLLALPVFILLGELMGESGAGRRLMALAARLVGPVPGGLAHVTLLGNAMLAAILGSTVAQIVLTSRLAVPEMERAGYPRDLAAAVTAAGGLLAPVLPPSMLFIVYGVIAQVPIGRLFIAGIVPGAAMLLGFVGVTVWLARRGDMPPPPPAPNRLATDRPARATARVMVEALPAALVPLAMVLAILGGLATAVEAGVIGALAVLLIGLFVYRELRLRDLGAALYRTAQSSAMILFLIAAAGLYGWVAAWQNLPAQVAAVLTGLTDDPVVFLLMVNVMLLALGMVLDPMPALVLVVPVFLPVATDSYGIDPMQFGLITCINLTLGLLTPPVGSGLFTAARLNAVSPVALTRRLLPYLGAAGAGLLLLTFVPAASTGLVGLLD